MPEKTRIIDIYEKDGAFSSVLRKLTRQKKDYNFSDMALLRRLLTNEKARLLNIVKTKKPDSIYSLAKFLGRDFKSVRQDLKLLEKFGFIEIIAKTKANRITHKPVITATTVHIVLRL